MANKSIKWNYIYNVAYQILTLITPFVTAPYLSRTLGAEGIGTISYAESIVAYFTLFATMGITTYGQREISYVQNDIKQRSVVFWNTKTLEFCTSIIAFVVYVLFALQQDNSILYLILSMYILEKTADISWFFQGMEEFGKILLRNIIIKALQIIYIFIFIKTKYDVFVYAAGLAGFVFLSSTALWTYLPRYITKISVSDLAPFKDIKVVLSLFVPTIAIQVYTVLDKTMIGIITGSAYENGYYEQAIKISKMTLHVVTALGTVMIPRIGYLFSHNKNDEVKRLMYRGYRFVWFLGIPFCFGLVICSGNFVPWFFGTGYDKVTYLLKILSFLILAIGINNVTGIQYLIPTKRQNIFTYTVIVGATVNFVLNYILIEKFQSIGAAIASVMAEVIIAIVQIIIIRKELSPLQIIKEGINYYVAGAVMIFVLIPLERKLAPSIINTALIIMSGGIVYLAMLLILRDDFFVSNIIRAGKLIKKHLNKFRV